MWKWQLHTCQAQNTCIISPKDPWWPSAKKRTVFHLFHLNMSICCPFRGLFFKNVTQKHMDRTFPLEEGLSRNEEPQNAMVSHDSPLQQTQTSYYYVYCWLNSNISKSLNNSKYQNDTMLHPHKMRYVNVGEISPNIQWRVFGLHTAFGRLQKLLQSRGLTIKPSPFMAPVFNQMLPNRKREKCHVWPPAGYNLPIMGCWKWGLKQET